LTITGWLGGTMVCASSGGELKARTAAIAALAGRSERMIPVIAMIKPASLTIQRKA
jgi:hypothetical protein